MLIISKMFSILCIPWLCGISFQNKAVSSNLFFQMSAQVKW